MTVPESTVQTAMTAARKTREYRSGIRFDVPHDAVESSTEAVVRAALAAVVGGGHQAPGPAPVGSPTPPGGGARSRD